MLCPIATYQLANDSHSHRGLLLPDLTLSLTRTLMAMIIFSVTKETLATFPAAYFVKLKPLFSIGRSSLFQSFCYSLRHSPSSLLVLVASTNSLLLLLSNPRLALATHSSVFVFLSSLWHIWQELFIIFLFYQAIMWAPSRIFSE